MLSLIKKIKSKIWSTICLKGVRCGKGCVCNNFCKFTKNTTLGTNCHFNGISISGLGPVIIGDNFHSGKRIRIINSFHNYKDSELLPYDTKMIDKEVIIEDNVWLGEAVLILGGVTIGEGAIIQAGSVVAIDVPPCAVAGGHPAVPFAFRDEEKYNILKENKRYL